MYLAFSAYGFDNYTEGIVTGCKTVHIKIELKLFKRELTIESGYVVLVVFGIENVSVCIFNKYFCSNDRIVRLDVAEKGFGSCDGLLAVSAYDLCFGSNSFLGESLTGM